MAKVDFIEIRNCEQINKLLKKKKKNKNSELGMVLYAFHPNI